MKISTPTRRPNRTCFWPSRISLRISSSRCKNLRPSRRRQLHDFAGAKKLQAVKKLPMKKFFLVVGIGAFVLLVAAVIVVALCLDGIVKKGVEVVGPQITKVSINLDSIHIG